jgi:selenocysteine lyase/cysteine desulfurase
MLDALRALIVADGANATPPVPVTVNVAEPAEFVTSPLKAGIAPTGNRLCILKNPMVSYMRPVVLSGGTVEPLILTTEVTAEPIVLVTSPVSAGRLAAGKILRP